MSSIGIIPQKKRGSTPLCVSRESLYIFVCIRFVVYHILLDTRSNHLTCRRETCSDYAASHLTDCAILDYAFSSINLPHNKWSFRASCSLQFYHYLFFDRRNIMKTLTKRNAYEFILIGTCLRCDLPVFDSVKVDF